MDSIEFLGHVVTEEGVRPLPAKLKAFLEIPPPVSTRSLAAFLGAANFWRKYVHA